MIKALTLLLFCTTCFGQLSMQSMQPFFGGTSSSVFYPTNLSGTWLRWWVASDNPTNITITNWVDRVLGESLTNTLALSPTNSALGMGFNGSTYFKMKHRVVTQVTDSNNTNILFMIIKPTAAPADFAGIYAGDDTTFYSGGRYLFGRTTSKFNWNSGASSDIGSAWTTGNLMDISLSGPDSAATSLLVYTNGILSVSLASGGYLYSDSMVSWNPNVSAGLKGFIVEILRGTNMTGSATQMGILVSNLHWYGTNTYHYSP